MTSKQLYYGNIKKRSAKKHDDALANLYQSNDKNNKQDIEEFLDNTPPKTKEKKSSDKTRRKRPHKFLNVLFRLLLFWELS